MDVPPGAFRGISVCPERINTTDTKAMVFGAFWFLYSIGRGLSLVTASEILEEIECSFRRPVLALYALGQKMGCSQFVVSLDLTPSRTPDIWLFRFCLIK